MLYIACSVTLHHYLPAAVPYNVTLQRKHRSHLSQVEFVKGSSYVTVTRRAVALVLTPHRKRAPWVRLRIERDV